MENIIKNNVLEMIKCRNIKIKTIKKFNEKENDNYVIINDEILIFYYLDNSNRVNIDVIKNIIKNHDEVNHYILIVDEKITVPAIKEIKKNENKEFEVFQTKEFRINIMNFYLQPKWKLLSEEKSKMIKNKNGTALMFLKKDDRIAKYFNAKIGDIFEIRRSNQIVYRMVVN